MIASKIFMVNLLISRVKLMFRYGLIILDDLQYVSKGNNMLLVVRCFAPWKPRACFGSFLIKSSLSGDLFRTLGYIPCDD